MFTFHSTQFNMKGFVMVLSASLLSGLRWTLAQLVTQKNKLGKGRNEKDKMGRGRGKGQGKKTRWGGGSGKMKKTRWEGAGKKTRWGQGKKTRDRKQQDGRWEKSQRERKFRWIATPMHEVYVIFAACIFI